MLAFSSAVTELYRISVLRLYLGAMVILAWATVVEMINTFRDYFYRYRSALLHIQDGISQSNQDHRQMLEAMKKKNPRLAERLVRRHLARGMQLILREIDEGRMIP